MNFTLTRLIIAVTASAVSLGVFARYGPSGGVVALLIGALVGVICLSIRASEIRPAARAGLFTLLGCLIGSVILDISKGGSRTSLSEVITHSIVGGLFGALICWILNPSNSEDKQSIPPR